MFDNYNPCLFFTRQRILTNFSPINLSKNIIQNNFYEDRRIVKTSVVFSQNKYIYFWKIFVPTILLITVENWFKDFFGRTNFDLYSINWFAFVTKKRNPFGKNWSIKNNKTRALHRMHSEKRIFSLRIQRKRNSKEALGRSQSFQRKDDPLSCSHIGQNDIVESVESKEYPIISIVECDHRHWSTRIFSPYSKPRSVSTRNTPLCLTNFCHHVFVLHIGMNDRLRRIKVDKNTRKIEGSLRFETSFP